MYSMSRATRVYGRFYSSDLTAQTTAEKAPPSSRQQYERIDWEGMRATALRGRIPTPPVLRTQDRSRWRLLEDVELAAKAGDRRKLAAMNIGDYNTVIRMIGRYRDLCIMALDRRV